MDISMGYCKRYVIHFPLTHWGRVTHICVNRLTIIGSDNGLSPGRHQAIIWANAGILLIRPLGTNFNVILIEILTFWFMVMRLKVSSAKWRPFCLGLNVLRNENRVRFRMIDQCFCLQALYLGYPDHICQPGWTCLKCWESSLDVQRARGL